ncbi:DUF3489 domain-containing protein [Novosphingobium sp. Gsoil 351]|nr:DUF3489 domain-containing protein [Novosphingobium sp. Gsoil 351]
MAREVSSPTANEEAKPHDTATPARAPSKIAGVVALLERKQGATLAEMVEATGWLPHTTRAALTGLKKKGRTITKDKRGDVTCYHVAASA